MNNEVYDGDSNRNALPRASVRNRLARQDSLETALLFRKCEFQRHARDSRALAHLPREADEQRRPCLANDSSEISSLPPPGSREGPVPSDATDAVHAEPFALSSATSRRSAALAAAGPAPDLHACLVAAGVTGDFLASTQQRLGLEQGLHESSPFDFGGAEFTGFQPRDYAEGHDDTRLTAVPVKEGEYELGDDDGFA